MHLAGRLGVRTIAEGVERPDQLALLRKLGGDAAQGFLYLRPVAADELTSWLAAQAATQAAQDADTRLPARR